MAVAARELDPTPCTTVSHPQRAAPGATRCTVRMHDTEPRKEPCAQAQHAQRCRFICCCALHAKPSTPSAARPAGQRAKAAGSHSAAKRVIDRPSQRPSAARGVRPRAHTQDGDSNCEGLTTKSRQWLSLLTRIPQDDRQLLLQLLTDGQLSNAEIRWLRSRFAAGKKHSRVCVHLASGHVHAIPVPGRQC